MNRSKISKHYKKAAKNVHLFEESLKNIRNTQSLETETQLCDQQSDCSLEKIPEVVVPGSDVPGCSAFDNESSETISNSSSNNLSDSSEIHTLKLPDLPKEKYLISWHGSLQNDRDTHTPISSRTSVKAPELGSARNPDPTCSENLCQCCPHLKQYFKEILKQQHIIRTRLNDLSHMVEQNSSKPNGTETEDESAFRGFNLPIDNVDQFKELNNFLKNLEEFSKGVAQMSKMGGSNTYDFAKRVLQTVMTNELASLYSWWGRRQKFKFCDLPFAQLVIAAAEKSGKAPDKKLIEEAVSSWLRRAKERKTRSVK